MTLIQNFNDNTIKNNSASESDLKVKEDEFYTPTNKQLTNTINKFK